MSDAKWHPILFSGPMVRAILEGRKTQTRRLVTTKQFKPGKAGVAFERDWPDVGSIRQKFSEWRCFLAAFAGVSIGTLRCPFGAAGARLWVREAWGFTARVTTNGHERWMREQDRTYMIYRATSGDELATWRPSIHMPRWASRLTLEVTEVRVQRLQEISEADVLAEGLIQRKTVGGYPGYGLADWPIERVRQAPQDAYEAGWDEINRKRGPWASNPYVWAITFRRIP